LSDELKPPWLRYILHILADSRNSEAPRRLAQTALDMCALVAHFGECERRSRSAPAEARTAPQCPRARSPRASGSSTPRVATHAPSSANRKRLLRRSLIRRGVRDGRRRSESSAWRCWGRGVALKKGRIPLLGGLPFSLGAR